MTKQLLTALLIAGLSATAKAEPVVYYCETISGQTIWVSGDSKPAESFRFKIKVDESTLKISRKIDGESSVTVYTLIDSYDPKLGTFKSNGLANPSRISSHQLTFNNKVLIHTFQLPGHFVSSYIAQCEDF